MILEFGGDSHFILRKQGRIYVYVTQSWSYSLFPRL